MSRKAKYYFELTRPEKMARLLLFANKKMQTGLFDRLMLEIGRRLKGQKSVRSRFGWGAMMVGDKSIRTEKDFQRIGGEYPLLQGGHILVEDKPGVGKTLLGEIIGRSLGGSFARIQGTEDIQPANIRGFEGIFRTEDGDVTRTMLGPIFNNIFLYDEMNRSSGLAHAACLDATTEERISLYTHGHMLSEDELRNLLEGSTDLQEVGDAVIRKGSEGSAFPLTNPFMLIGTQNPFDSKGTNFLPEASLDRFSMKVMMEALTTEDMVGILGTDQDLDLTVINPVCSLEEWQETRQFLFYCVEIDEVVSRYIARLALAIEPYPTRPDQVTRLKARRERMRERGEPTDEEFDAQWRTLYDREIPLVNAYSGEVRSIPLRSLINTGRAVRTALFLRRLAKIRAACEGRLHVIPNDVRKVAPEVMRHRFLLHREAREYADTFERREALIHQIIEFILDNVSVPLRM